MIQVSMADNPSETDESDEVDAPSTTPQYRDLTILDAYTIGANILYLRVAGRENHRLGSPTEGNILGAIENIQNRLIETRTALRVAEEAEEFKELLYNAYEGEDSDTKIGESLGVQLTQSAKTWGSLLEEAFANEARVKIPNSGILDWEQLMMSPGSIFGDNVWESMDSVPKNDVAEACRSLPMRCPTASVMVSLRAVEHYLRKWHTTEIGEEIGRGTWGSVLDELMDEYIDEEDRRGSVLQQLSNVPGVLSNIYYLKEKRDKVSHPDETPTDYEAVITLFLVAGTISEICVELGEIEDMEIE